MKKEFNRRKFVSGCFKAGTACIILSGGKTLFATGAYGWQDEKPDPKKLEYCGYKCPAECPLKKATLENNLELRRKAYAEFNFKDKYKVDFDAGKVFCYGCKTEDKPVSIPAKACTVRQCVINKGLDCCIQCDNLAKCDKELWKEFPKLREHVLGLQAKYTA
jgi:hypothetical protein